MSVENNTNETMQLSEEAKTPEQIVEKQKGDALDMLSPEVREYLRINGIGDIASMPIEMLREMNNHSGAGRGNDIPLAGLQENLGAGIEQSAPETATNPMQRIVDASLITANDLNYKDVSVTEVLSASPSTVPTVTMPGKSIEGIG